MSAAMSATAGPTARPPTSTARGRSRPGRRITSSSEGALGGPQLGFNYQFAPHWLIGVEGDYSWSDISDTTSRFSTVPPFTATRFLTSNGKIEWLATLTGRLGYAVDNWLFYGKGGAAWGHFEVNSQTTNPVAGTLQATVSGGETRTGWTAGGGIEWGFLGNWSARLEYDYIDFGSQTVSRNVTFAVCARAQSAAAHGGVAHPAGDLRDQLPLRLARRGGRLLIAGALPAARRL